MNRADSVYTKLAKSAIAYTFEKGEEIPLPEPEVIDPLLEIRAACFVSIHNSDNSLRGCIGTIEAREHKLYHEIVRNALAAAFHDLRFEALTKKEFESVKIGVDILSQPEKVNQLSDLNPQLYGIIVSDGNKRKAVLLPNLTGINSPEEQIRIVKKKAGLEEVNDSLLHFYRFTSERYG